MDVSVRGSSGQMRGLILSVQGLLPVLDIQAAIDINYWCRCWVFQSCYFGEPGNG